MAPKAKAPAAKAATPAKAEAPAAAPAEAKPAKTAKPDLATLEDKKKFVLKHEVKIDDAEQAAKDEPNRTAKKSLENALKKLQQDETYLKVLQEIKELEDQAAKDAERAALKGKDATKAGAKAKGEKAATEDKPAVKMEKADQKIMAEIDAAFAASGKDAAKGKEEAVARMEGLAASTPFVLPRLDKLISLFDNSKLSGPAVKAATAICEQSKPKGHGIATVAVPLLLAGMDDKKWKIKAGCIEVLLPCLKQMEATPAQLAQCLPLIVSKLAEAALEVRAEIRNGTAAVLREIGSLVASPEIKRLSQDLVTALAEPTNQKHTQAVLAKIGNQTFLSLIDAASLALLMPVIVRGLKERDSMSKKWSAQIFGSTSMLVHDVEAMRPYLKSVVPLLQTALTDPVAEVQREAAKAFGVLEQVLPEYSIQNNLPWLFGKLRTGELGEQLGSSQALAEVFLKMDKTFAAALIPEIEAGTADEKASVRRGFLELMDTMPQAMKMDFVPYITRLFPRMLMGISGDKDKDEDAGLKASMALVHRFGDLCPDLLLPAFESVFAATLHADTAEERNRQLTVRDKSCSLLGKLADKILEHKKFGQDLLTTDDCSNKATREWLLVLLFIMGRDSDASVKRYANGAWKNCGGAPKLQKAILPAIEKMLLRMRSGELGLGMQKLSAKIFDELVKAKELEAPAGDEPEPAEKYAFALPADRQEDSKAARIAAGKMEDDLNADASGAFTRLVSGSAAAQDVLTGHAAFAPLPADVVSHCKIVSSSIMTEYFKKKSSGAKIASILAEELKSAIEHLNEAEASAVTELPAIAESVVRAAMGDAFDAKGGAADEDDELLLRVESLLLMYGGGKLLLKDTVLEMRKACCYGVVGQNGAGKTTLMKEIANRRIVGMPQDLTCVHVDDSKLGVMSKSSLSCVEYAMKMALDQGINNAGKATLLEVGFTEKMLDEPVSELSVGWRMRMTLAVAMMKHADLVLLDEPTNHLDEESVQWLGEYIKAIKGSSVMVISHEPKFLNRICTHIMAYVDKKLEYTVGDFTSFAAARGLTKEQIDAMLSGNLSFDTKKEGEEGEEGEDGAPKIAAPVAGPPKLSFPIPGAMEGVKSASRAVLEVKNLSFRYSKDKDFLVHNASLKLSLNARVAICGRNGCGKSTLLTLLCSEMNPSEDKDGSLGDVTRNCNLRLGHLKQDHLKSLGPFFDTSSFVYITTRFKDGFDGDLQKRLIEPEDEEEADRRKRLAKEHGKYGNEVDELVSRTKLGTQMAYEVHWKGLDDPKQNSVEPLSKLKAMGLDKVVIACDERIAAKAAGLDQRPLTRREVVKHCEAFGIDEEMCCNQQIQGFSAGQKVRLSLAAMFWTKPHLIALDEPTNYLDVETVEALAKGLTNFRGGIVMIEPKTDFVEKICNEKWHLEGGEVTVEKLKNGAKRAA